MGKCPICGQETIRGNVLCIDCYMNSRTLDEVSQRTLDQPEELE